MKLNPKDAEKLGVVADDLVRLSNANGATRVHVEPFEGVQQGIVIVESVWPNDAFVDGIGINVLTSADPGAPVGGGLFHDTAVNIEKA